MRDKRFHGDQWLQKQIEKRMQSTLEKLQAQGKAPAGSIESLRGTKFYKSEFKRQAQMFKRERNAQRQAREAAENEKRKIRIMHDMAWGEEHREDTDEQLLEYVRGCASEIGCTPYEKDVPGGAYIRERFGSWAVVLHFAGLPLRHGMKPANPVTLNAYLKKRQDEENPAEQEQTTAN